MPRAHNQGLAHVRGGPRRINQGSAAVSAASLFASGEQGAWYDPSDLTTMWQDSAGTTPAVVDSPVGKINDKSGRGNHLTQATAGFRPILRSVGGKYYLEFDGVDDNFAPTNFMSAATTASAAWAAKRDAAVTGTTDRSVLDNFGTAGGTSLEPWSGDGKFYSNFGSTTRPSFPTLMGTGTNAYVMRLERNATNLIATLNKSTVLGSNATAVGWSAAPNIGGNFAGRVYGIILLARVMTAGEIASVEAYLAGKNGVTLP